jgi:hypothetical protein
MKGHYCGLCNAEGKAGVPRPEESREEFRAHVETHDSAFAQELYMRRKAKVLGDLIFGKGRTEPSGCWCICHLDKDFSIRQACMALSDDQECHVCGRKGAQRYK